MYTKQQFHVAGQIAEQWFEVSDRLGKDIVLIVYGGDRVLSWMERSTFLDRDEPEFREVVADPIERQRVKEELSKQASSDTYWVVFIQEGKCTCLQHPCPTVKDLEAIRTHVGDMAVSKDLTSAQRKALEVLYKVAKYNLDHVDPLFCLSGARSHFCTCPAKVAVHDGTVNTKAVQGLVRKGLAREAPENSYEYEITSAGERLIERRRNRLVEKA
jgi:hypothetical protein